MGFMDKLKKITGTEEYNDDVYEDDAYYNDITDGYEEDPAQAQGQQPSQPQQSGGQYGYNQTQQGQYSNTGYAPVTPPPAPAGGLGGGINIGGSALQMKVIRPESFASVSQIADHLLSQRTVVLNLEATNKETARRLIDFLSGVAYSIDGSLKRIANNAYIITPSNVDVSGEQLREQRKAQAAPAHEDDDEGAYSY